MVLGGAIIRVGFEEMQEQKCGHYSSHHSDHYLCQAWALGQVRHQCKSLSYVAEYLSLSNLLQIMYLLSNKKFDGSLSKHLRMW